MRTFVSTAVTLVITAAAAGQNPVADNPIEVARAAVGYLRPLQGRDGGFRPAAAAAGSSLRATSAALGAFRFFSGQPADPEACAEFVRRCHDRRGGGFADWPGGTADVLATAAGLGALHELRLPVEPYLPQALAYLRENTKTLEAVGAVAEALDGLPLTRPVPGAQAWLDKVAAVRRGDGTAGDGDGAAVQTARTLTAALRLGGEVGSRAAVLNTLAAGQRADGGFGKAGARGSDLGSTYQVAQACRILRWRPDTSRVRAFVQSCRNPDGGFGPSPGKPSTVLATYHAAFLLYWVSGKF